MSTSSKSFRIGRVRGDLRGRVWYLTYVENGRRYRPRAGKDRKAAQTLAAQINAQLEADVPASLSFEPITLAELRVRWLEHHEHVLRSSVQTIRRYRAATRHLERFLETERVPQSTAHFRVSHAEQFVRYLRALKVSPNGHAHAVSRPLLDKGIRFILEVCRSLFNYALKRRHLPPYSDNPFAILQLDRIPVEQFRPIVLLTPDQERMFLEACDDWQFPLFLTLMLTGMRPGELTHLLLPDDFDRDSRSISIRNRAYLGWQVKTRHEREIPVADVLSRVLQVALAGRECGTLFRRRKYSGAVSPPLAERTAEELQREVDRRVAEQIAKTGGPVSRVERLRICRGVWRDLGAVKTEQVRNEFIRICRGLGLSQLTSPKMLRHLFATGLQDANVDPLVRNELMGHVPDRQDGLRGLGMTAAYTHTRPETKRHQLETALLLRPAVQVAEQWLRSRESAGLSQVP